MIAKSLSELLDRLVAAREAREASRALHELRARVVLANGLRIHGTVVERTRDVLVMREDASEHHVAVDQVVAVTLDDAHALRDVLSDGARERPQQAQSKLQIARTMKSVGETLGVSLQADSIPEANSARLALTELVDSVQHALASIFQDFGDEALATLHDLRIEDASPAGVELRGDVVIIRADLEGGPRGRLDREELEKGLLAIS